MDRKHWHVKFILGGGALAVALGDLAFGSTVSRGVLLFVGALMLAEAFADRAQTRAK